MKSEETIEMDLHGYHPTEIVLDVLKKIIQQAWEMGKKYVTLIHGHGRNRPHIRRGLVRTNTGYFGLEIRRALRHDKELRQFIKYSTLDCSRMGATSVKLKPNPAPTRRELDHDLLPEPSWY
jgi:Smr domain-containing protein